MVRLIGFEPMTARLEGGCSIQLSYRRLFVFNDLRDSGAWTLNFPYQLLVLQARKN